MRPHDKAHVKVRARLGTGTRFGCGAVRGGGSSVGARACGAVFGAVCGTARGAGIRTELAAESPELAADSAANLRISADREQGTPHCASTHTELAAEIRKFLPLIRYG